MKTRYLAFALLNLAAASFSRAQSFIYTDFSSTSGLQLNGNAATQPGFVPADGTVLRLTPNLNGQAGSAFSTSQIVLQNAASFSTEFAFRISDGHGGDGSGIGADGIMFVVQTTASTVGGGGGGIGYQGLNKSFAVEFDTWNNGFSLGDNNNGNHVALNFNGVLAGTDLTPISTLLNNGALWHAWVDYNGSTNSLQVRLSETSLRPVAALIDHTVDLQSILGQNSAYVGFTAGTGAANENHDIVSWQFNNDYKPIETIGGNVPDASSTLALLSLSLVGLFALSRRSTR